MSLGVVFKDLCVALTPGCLRLQCQLRDADAWLFNTSIINNNERSSPAAKQLASVARKMVMREIAHCCQ